MIFENKDLGMGIKVAMFGDQIYTVGSHLAATLGYVNDRKAISDHVDETCQTTVKNLRDSIQNFEGNETFRSPINAELDTMLSDLGLNIENTSHNQAKLITESGIYQLILRSKHPKANKFQMWVCSEVLPSIRKHGMYLAGQNTISTEEFNQLKTKVVQVIDEMNSQSEIIKEQQKLLAVHQAPKYLPIALLTHLYGPGFYEDSKMSKAFLAGEIFIFLKRLGLACNSQSTYGKKLTDQGRKLFGFYVEEIDPHTKNAKLKYHPEAFDILPELAELYDTMLATGKGRIIDSHFNIRLLRKKYMNL
jgi:prophage antirepressor-like protein